MRGIVLADTGPLYAVRDPDDAQHSRAQRELGRLRSQNLKVVVPYPALLEGYTLVMRELGIREAHDEGRRVAVIEGQPNPVFEDVSKGQRERWGEQRTSVTTLRTNFAEIR